MTVVAASASRRAALARAERELAAAGIATAGADAEWLLAGVLDTGRAAARLDLEEPLAAPAAARFAAAVRRRAGREPLQRILGWEGFRGHRVRVDGPVLIPRPETELLVEWALALLPPARPGRRPRAIDVGTGSGCVACALAAERPDLRVVAVDLCPAAAALARANAIALGVAGRVRVVAGDLLEAVAGPADLVVANLPYLPSAVLAALDPEVRLHEPGLALDGGADGLDVIRRLVPAARSRLAHGGALVLETAGGTQAEAVTDLMRAAGLSAVETRADLAGVRRFVAGNA